MDIKDAIELIFIILMGLTEFIKQVKSWFKKKKYSKNNNIKNVVDFDVKIYEKLVECRVNYRADRCSFFQFHNGEIYFSNNSILKLSLTHETTSEGTTEIRKIFQNSLVSKYPKFMKKLLLEDVISYNISDEITDDELSNELQYHGIDTFYYVKVLNKQKEIIGFLFLGFTRKHEKFDLSLLKEYADNIGYLASR